MERTTKEFGSIDWLLEALAKLPSDAVDEDLGADTRSGAIAGASSSDAGGSASVYRSVDTELGR